MARSRKECPAVAPEAPALLTTAEAMALARCTRRTLSRWIASGRIDSVRPVSAGSGRRLILRSSLLDFLGVGVEAVTA